MDKPIFRENFRVTIKDAGGRFLDDVTRFTCSNKTMTLVIDVHSEICNLETNSLFTLILSETEPKSLNSNNYVMYGQVFKILTDPKTKLHFVFISCGGLLLSIQTTKKLTKFNVDQNLYVSLQIIE